MDDNVYSEWSECSKPCGGGTRERPLKEYMKNLGLREHCEEKFRKISENCNEFHCNGKIFFD